MFQQSSYTDQLTFFQKLRSFDYTLLLCILIIGIIICFSMYSTDGGDLLYHSKSHIIRFAVFFIMMIFLSFLSIRFWHSMGYFFYLVVLLLLIAASLYGVSAQGSQRWINLYFLNIQPSELMKISIIIFFAKYYHRSSIQSVNSFKNLIIPIVVLIIPILFGKIGNVFLKDLLRISSNYNNYLSQMNLKLIEKNKTLIKFQKNNLKEIKRIKSIKWLNNLDSSFDEKTIFFANEFFDCFPIKQLFKYGNDYFEKVVKYNKKDDKFIIINLKINEKKDLIKKVELIYNNNNLKDKSIIEISPLTDKYIYKIGNILLKNKGFAIIIDYGNYFTKGFSTIQGLGIHVGLFMFLWFSSSLVAVAVVAVVIVYSLGSLGR